VTLFRNTIAPSYTVYGIPYTIYGVDPIIKLKVFGGVPSMNGHAWKFYYKNSISSRKSDQVVENSIIKYFQIRIFEHLIRFWKRN